MATIPDGAAQVFSEVTRFSVLDADGKVAVGANTFTTTALLKATFTPNMETGVDLVTINANGDIAQHFKHGDMPKYYEMTLDMSSPDPVLTQMLAGGVLLTDSGTALATPGTITATPSASGGTLASATYSYKVTAANQYGETLASAAVTAVVTGPNGSVGLSLTAVTGAVYYKWYGRTSGGEQFVAQTLTPAYTDTGAATPSGALPTTNTTAGPGTDTGYQAPALGVVGNTNGVAVEFWGKAIVNGTQTAYLPYFRWAVPGVKNLRPEARTFGPELLPNVWMGQAFENPNWGSGPFGDWQFDSSKVYQYARAARTTMPTAGFAAVPATV